jgi:hypothetical protein
VLQNWSIVKSHLWIFGTGGHDEQADGIFLPVFGSGTSAAHLAQTLLRELPSTSQPMVHALSPGGCETST